MIRVRTPQETEVYLQGLRKRADDLERAGVSYEGIARQIAVDAAKRFHEMLANMSDESYARTSDQVTLELCHIFAYLDAYTDAPSPAN